MRQRWEIIVHASLYSQQQKVFSVRGQLALRDSKLESPAELLSLQFLLITLVKGDSVLPLKVRVC